MILEVGATLPDALKRGLPLYRTVKKCRLGHDAPRYVKSRQCVKCTHARNSAAAAASRVEAPKLADSQPAAPQREVRNYDPGTRISPERISAVIDRIFLGHESVADAA